MFGLYAMVKYTLAQILEAWEAVYGEDMQEEYSGFIEKLSEENAKPKWRYRKNKDGFMGSENRILEKK